MSLPFTPGNVPHTGKVVASFFGQSASRQRRHSPPHQGPLRHSHHRTVRSSGCRGARNVSEAVQLLPERETPKGFDQVKGDKLDDAGVEQAISAALSGHPLTGQSEQDDFRISIAGAQEKTALLFHQGHWWRPHGLTPTTHIFKLPLGVIGNLQIDMPGFGGKRMALLAPDERLRPRDRCLRDPAVWRAQGAGRRAV